MLIIADLDARFCCLSRSSHSKMGASSGTGNNAEDEETEEGQEGEESRLRQEGQESEEGEKEVDLRHRSAGFAFLTKTFTRAAETVRGRFVPR
jgi:hypothetical protein